MVAGGNQGLLRTCSGGGRGTTEGTPYIFAHTGDGVKISSSNCELSRELFEIRGRRPGSGWGL